MKRIFTFAIISVLLSVVFFACASSKGGHCDAYGSVNNTENSDLATK